MYNSFIIQNNVTRYSVKISIKMFDHFFLYYVHPLHCGITVIVKCVANQLSNVKNNSVVLIRETTMCGQLYLLLVCIVCQYTYLCT